MKEVCVLLVLGLAFARAVPTKIVGGSLTTIDRYPTIVSLLIGREGSSFWQACGATIINTRSILTAAHCTINEQPPRVRARVGSTFANSGGTVHSIINIINHPQFNRIAYMDSDISIVRTASTITYVNNAVQPGTFAGPNYNTGDNAVVWAAGWGKTSLYGPVSEQLRHVQVYTINQQICLSRYGTGWTTITDNMLCSGVLDEGGRDQCAQDSGGPLYHNNIVVGVCSFGTGCGSPFYPGVNVRVSRFSNWIQANA